MNPIRKRKGLCTVGVAALTIALLVWPVMASAYGLTGVGGSLGYASPENLDGTASLGVHAVLEQPGTRLHMDPNVRYWNVNGVSDLAPNMDVTYHFGPESRWTPYVGGGLGVNFVHDRAFDRTSSDLGLNAIAGVRFPNAGNRVFLEGRYTASDVDQVSVQTGITFRAR
jgi:hypothetical protein